jgi:hypothetical protein
MKLTLQNGKLVSQDGIEVENWQDFFSIERDGLWRKTKGGGFEKMRGETIDLPEGIEAHLITQFKNAFGRRIDSDQFGDTHSNHEGRQIIRLKPVEKHDPNGFNGEYIGDLVMDPITKDLKIVAKKADAVEHSSAPDKETPYWIYIHGINNGKVSNLSRLDFINARDHFERLKEVNPEFTPNTDTQDRDIDVTPAYMDRIINTLMDKWHLDMKSARDIGRDILYTYILPIYELGGQFKLKVNQAPKADTQESQAEHMSGAGDDSFIIPDNGDHCWTNGSEHFTRQEVFSLLWTQRAMISNDLKRVCGNDLPPDAFNILKNPRVPKF